MKDKKYYIIYETTNLINGKKYAGAHETIDLDDNYMGSGKLLKQAIKKYGKDNFKREILSFWDDSASMYDAESEYVNEEYVARDDTYNLKVGGEGGWDHLKNKISVYDNDNNIILISCDDERWLSGQFIHVNSGRTMSDENVEKLSIRLKSIKRTDEWCNKISKSLYGKKHTIERRLNNSKAQRGEKHHNYGKKCSEETRRKMSIAQRGVKKHRVTCPHCGQIGAIGNMKYHHFDNCKYIVMY